MHERVHCCDEAANRQLPIAAAFWIIPIVSMEECTSLTQNWMQIRCSTHSYILNAMAAQYTCSFKSIYHSHWLVQWSRHCSRTRMPVHPPWLPGYIDAAQTILVNDGWTFSGQTCMLLLVLISWLSRDGPDTWRDPLILPPTRASHKNRGCAVTEADSCRMRKQVTGDLKGPQRSRLLEPGPPCIIVKWASVSGRRFRPLRGPLCEWMPLGLGGCRLPVQEPLRAASCARPVPLSQNWSFPSAQASSLPPISWDLFRTHFGEKLLRLNNPYLMNSSIRM